MNYYPHHVGDYAAATGHLSLLEHGVYRMLLDAYYESERPLPADRKRVYRRVRATTKAERQAVDAVLDEFFQEGPDGLRHARCDAEIARARDKSEKNSSAAGSRWRKSKSISEQKKSTKSTADPMRTHSERNANAMPPNNQYPIANTKDFPSSNELGSASDHSGRRSERDDDPVKRLFDAGVAVLIGGGEPERNARSVIGKLRQTVGDDEAFRIITAARDKSNPTAYVIAAMKPKPKQVSL